MRHWIRLCACLIAGLLLANACGRHNKTGRRVIVLGVDGLDYGLVRDLIDRGRMPNFARLAKAGRFSALETSTPPQSPVAWSTFITGLDPGRHGIFDFIHRNPKTMTPFLSTTRTEDGSWTIGVGHWQFPLRAGHVELLRRGEAFWDVLERHGIETTIVRMPANFPPSGAATRELSGMGTPDMLGTYGSFSFFTSDTQAFSGRSISGGVVVPVAVIDNTVHAQIDGPDHPYLVPAKKTHVEFAVYLDRVHGYAKLVVGEEERILHVGEWSDWVPVSLPLMPLDALSGECRFYLKQVDPQFELYVSPINIDPLRPALPISSPGSYAAELARGTGRFYTQGMPEDTKGLKAGVLSPEEFLTQAGLTEAESKAQYSYTLDHFTDGFLFYYFGHVDQVSHMMWRAMDPGHPAYTDADAKYRDVVPDLYADIDTMVGETLRRLGPNDLLVVMSDHGFMSWRRSFSVNSWLRDHGYLAVRDPDLATDPGLFANVDWARTRAYALGLNGVYINVRGREAHGIVDPSDRLALATEIATALQRAVDPATGTAPIRRMFRREDVYQMRDIADLAPDLIVGYAKGTRASDESSLGAVPRAEFADNTDAWSGDHCVDPAVVPGILLTSRPLRRPAASGQALAGAIVAEFGIEGFPEGKEK